MDKVRRITFLDNAATTSQSFRQGRTYEVESGLAESLLRGGIATPEIEAPIAFGAGVDAKKKTVFPVDKVKNEMDDHKPASK